MTDTHCSESRDDTGKPGDRDQPYSFGEPMARLNWHQRARVLALRGQIIDARAGMGPGVGDLNDTVDIGPTVERPSGLIVPATADLD